MRPSKFSEEQIQDALREVRAGSTAVSVCRSLGITQTTFYRWRNQHEDLSPGEMRRLRELEEENLRLKQLVANLLLEKQDAADVRGRRK